MWLPMHVTMHVAMHVPIPKAEAPIGIASTWLRLSPWLLSLSGWGRGRGHERQRAASSRERAIDALRAAGRHADQYMDWHAYRIMPSRPAEGEIQSTCSSTMV